MEWVQITAKTVEEARERALDTLGVDEQDVEIIIVEEPRTGLLGRLKGQALVRARVRPAPVRPKVERPRRGKGRDQRGKGGSGREAKGGQSAPSTATDEPAAAPAAAAESGTGQAAARRRRRGGRGSGGAERPEGRARAGQGNESDESGSDRGEEGATMPDLTIDEQAEVVSDFLLGLAERFGASGSSTEITRVDDDTVEIALSGDELGLLIGPKGQTLYLVQELARTSVQRRGGGVHEGRVRIDIAGYRKKRGEALARFTEQVAADVVASGSAKALEPMNASDRKVVHDTANGIEGVRTTSEGEDPRRRVVIHPDD